MDCLYYDITSTYFEGTKCIIARLGYSRDGKTDKLQVNIGLVVAGNETDMKTVGRAISRLKEEFAISDCLDGSGYDCGAPPHDPASPVRA